MPRIYPSNQDTNLTAKGSVIITYNDILPTNIEDYIQVNVNGVLRDRDYQLSEGVYSTHLNIGDIVAIDMFTPTTVFKNITIYRRDYTTDDNNDWGIVENFIAQENNSTNTITITFTATTLNSGYNFEYRVSANVGTNPTEGCFTTGFAGTFENNYFIAGTSITGGTFYPARFYYSYTGQTTLSNPSITTYTKFQPIINNITIKDATLNYYGDIINYIKDGDAPKYNINANVLPITGLTSFSASTITFNNALPWSSIDCSPDGKYQVLGQTDGLMYVSSNSGQTYSSISGSTKSWNKVRVPNKNGYPFYGITNTSRDYIYIFNSISGFTTLSANARPPSGSTLTDFAVSRNNKYVVGVYVNDNLSTNTNIMVSSNSGSTFTTINTGFNLYNPLVAMSSTGKYVYIANTENAWTGGNVLKSSDYGVTWTDASSGKTFSGAAGNLSINCSGTGKYVFVSTLIYGSPELYVSEDFLNSWQSEFGIDFLNCSFLKPNKN